MKRYFALITWGIIAILALASFTTEAKANQVIYAKALDDHECDSSEWHFVITQISDPSLAPQEIYVTWKDGSSETLPLDKVTGGVAHYSWYTHMDVPVVEAWTEIYDEWDGQFNLSHGPCFEYPTPTMTYPPTETPEETPTMTYTPTQPPVTPTSTSTQPDVTPTSTSTQPDFTPTSTQPDVTPTETFTPTPVSTNTETPVPTETPYPPKPSFADSHSPYPGKYLGTMKLSGMEFILYEGVKAEDGSLLLPSLRKGGALYNNTIWVHNQWKDGSIELNIGSKVYVMGKLYFVTDEIHLQYGVYPSGNGLYLATCYKENGKWEGVSLYTLESPYE